MVNMFENFEYHEEKTRTGRTWYVITSKRNGNTIYMTPDLRECIEKITEYEEIIKELEL